MSFIAHFNKNGGSTIRVGQHTRIMGWHTPFVLSELFILGIGLLLAATVHSVRGPLVGDVHTIVAWQQLVLPHQTITQIIDEASVVNWPNPALIGLIVICVGLLLLRQWVEAIMAAAISGLGDASSYLVNQVVQRPRPQGYGVYVAQQINTYYSFPSGHVVHVYAFFGFLLFLTFQQRYRQWWWLWLPRILLIALVVLIGPSRLLQGEHWPSDVLGGLLLGSFWLILGVHIYNWVERRWFHHQKSLAPESS